MKNLDDWYNINTQNIIEYGGSGLLKYEYNSSISKMIKTIYPNHNVKSLLILILIYYFSGKFGNLIKFLQDIGIILKIKKNF